MQHTNQNSNTNISNYKTNHKSNLKSNDIQIEQIWKDFNRELFYFILGKVKNREIASDILQDVFLKIQIKIDTINDINKLTSWIYQITRNSIIDHFRLNKKSKVDDSIQIEDFEEIIPENIDDNKEILSSVYKCLIPFIDNLSNEYKTAINETVIGNLNQIEYANKFNLGYSTAKSRVQRAKVKLKDLFVNCCNVSFDKYGNIIEFEHKNNCECGCRN